MRAAAVLSFIFIVGQSLSAKPCDASLGRSAYLKVTLKAFEEHALTDQEIRSALQSDVPVNPFSNGYLNAGNAAYFAAFEQLLKNPELNNEWPAIRKALHAALALQNEADTQIASAKADTHAILNPQKIREYDTSPKNGGIAFFKTKDDKLFFAVDGPNQAVSVYDIEKSEPIWTSSYALSLATKTFSEDENGKLKIHFAFYAKATLLDRVFHFTSRKIRTETFSVESNDAQPQIHDLFIKPNGVLSDYLVDSEGRQFLKFTDQTIAALSEKPVLFEPTERSEISPWWDPSGRLHFAYYRHEPGGIHAQRDFYNLTFNGSSWNSRLIHRVEGESFNLTPLRDGTVQLNALTHYGLIHYAPTDLVNWSGESAGRKSFSFLEANGAWRSHVRETKAFETRSGRILIAVATSYSEENNITIRVLEPAAGPDPIYQWEIYRRTEPLEFFWFEDTAGNPYLSVRDVETKLHQPLNPSVQPIKFDIDNPPFNNRATWIGTKEQAYLFYRDDAAKKLRIHTAFTRVR